MLFPLETMYFLLMALRLIDRPAIAKRWARVQPARMVAHHARLGGGLGPGGMVGGYLSDYFANRGSRGGRFNSDRQTVGGYPKIATVASVDLPRLGRLLPGQTVRFAAITVEEAETLRRDQDSRLQRAIAAFVVARPPGGIDLARLYEENLIDGIVYE